MLRSVNTGPRRFAGGRVAEMPSAGRILRVSIAGVVAAASMGLAASSASANDVWLWACHGPSGQPLPSAAVTAKSEGTVTATELNGGCRADAATADAGWTLAGSGTPAAGASATLQIKLPPGAIPSAVKIDRALRGFEG